MENQTPPVGGQPMPQAPVVEQPTVPAQPVQQAPQSQPSQPTGNSKLMWIVLILIIAILLLTAGAYYFFVVSKNNTSTSFYQAPGISTQYAGPTETPVPTVTQVQTSSDLNSALSQINSTTPSAASELNQNAADSTSFTP